MKLKEKFFNFIYKIIYNQTFMQFILKNSYNFTYDGAVNSPEIKKLFKNNYNLDESNFYNGDSVYYTPTENTIKQFLNYDLNNFRLYKKNNFDCDDYSFCIKGNASYLLSGYAIGIVWVTQNDNTAHALNFYINNQREIIFIEPQTDKIIDEKDINFIPYFVII
jgi:hypothetical protein